MCGIITGAFCHTAHGAYLRRPQRIGFDTSQTLRYFVTMGKVGIGEPRFDDGGWYVGLSCDGKETVLGPYRSQVIARRLAVRKRNELERVERAARIAATGVVGEPDGTLGWYARAMDHIAAMVLAGGGKESREDLKALAMASVARRQLHDMEAAERELREAQSLLDERRRAEIHGTRLQATGAGAVIRALPGASIR